MNAVGAGLARVLSKMKDYSGDLSMNLNSWHIVALILHFSSETGAIRKMMKKFDGEWFFIGLLI
jgi:hypothetical protein